MEITDYNGMAYSFRSYNCWDHAVAVRKDFGIKTKLFAPSNLESAFAVITAEMQKLDHGLVSAETPQNFDVVIAGKMTSKRMVYHCGIYFNGMISHCDRYAKQVRMESLDDFKAGFEGVTFWR